MGPWIPAFAGKTDKILGLDAFALGCLSTHGLECLRNVRVFARADEHILPRKDPYY